MVYNLEQNKRRTQAHKETIEKLLSTNSLGSLTVLNDLSAGYAGYVYRAGAHTESGDQNIIVKLTPKDSGVNFTRLKPTYDLLVKSGIPTYKLLAFGDLNDGTRYFYQLMSPLEGESIREFLAYETHPQMDQLHYLAGEVLGKMHQITRSQRGGVSEEVQTGRGWKEEFFDELDRRWKIIGVLNNPFIKIYQTKIKDLVKEGQSIWTDPPEFVLSHNDGLQGIVRFEDSKWKFVGVIDVEDHYFMDPRLILAGYELSLNFEGREVPNAFWEAYKQYKNLDPSYEKLKKLFQLYYLLDWFPMVFEKDWRGDPKDKEKVIQKFERAFLRLLA